MILLLVDDDEIFRLVLARALQKRGFEVQCAFDVNSAVQLLQSITPQYAVVDLKMEGDSGLILVAYLKKQNPDISIVMLTGYASIATAVEAIKLGATHYLAKPADADEIVAAFERHDGDITMQPPIFPMSVPRLEWEHLQRVLTEHHGNISATARSLNMHRRTLQRKLMKYPAKR